MQRRALLITGAATVALAACGGGASRAPSGTSRGGPDVLGVARGAGAGRFARAVEEAGLGETLAGPGPFTLFAPTDRAMAAAGRLDGEALKRMVAYHIVPGELTTDFLSGMNLNHTSMLGPSVNVDGRGGPLNVEGANVVRADLPASNGIVFTIDRVLSPG